jgi:crossover junction endodeoxyribonuclease RuvC
LRILGIDPSLRATGWVVVENRKVIGWGVIRTKGNLVDSLAVIRDSLSRIVEELRPDKAVMEAIIYHRNPKVAILLGAVRGVILLTLKDTDVPVEEVSPSKLKMSSTRFGNAPKEQVAYMLKSVYNLNEDVPDHVTDALAAANYVIK